mgnify:CR=1 FL=1
MSRNANNTASMLTPLAAIGLIAVGVVLMLQRQPSDFFAEGGAVIGQVSDLSGGAQVRPDVVQVWRDLKEGDVIRDSDRIATGDQTRLKVKLAGGVQLELAEYSQIWLRSLVSGTAGREYDIELLRGTLVATNPKACNGGAPCEPVIVKSGGTTLNVESGKRIGYFKQVGEWPQKFDPKTTWPTLDRPAIARAIVEQSRDEQPERQQPTRTPDPTPPPAPDEPAGDLSARGFEPSLVVPASVQSLVSLRSTAALASESLTVTIVPPARRPQGSTWTPFVEISDANGNAQGTAGRILGQARFGRQTVAIPVSRVFAIAGAGDARYFLRPGVIVKRGREEKFSFGTRSGPLSIRVLAAGGGSTLVGFDSTTPGRNNSAWLAGKSVVNPVTTPIQVLLRFGNDYSRLVPFLAGSNRVGVAARGFDQSNGVFLVRSGAVVAKVLGGAAGNRATVSGIARALGCDLAYRGSGNALVPVGNDINGAVGRLKSLVDQGRSIYIYNGSSVEFISGTFIKTSSDLPSFLRSQAKAVFTQQVQVIR